MCKPYWFITKGGLWQPSESNFTDTAQDIISKIEFENYTFIIIFKSPKGHWLHRYFVEKTFDIRRLNLIYNKVVVGVSCVFSVKCNVEYFINQIWVFYCVLSVCVLYCIETCRRYCICMCVILLLDSCIGKSSFVECRIIPIMPILTQVKWCRQAEMMRLQIIATKAQEINDAATG